LRYRIFPDFGLSPLYGGWEEEAQRLMVEHLRPGFVAYDVGGNYGIHTLLMARLVKEDGHVYAFEPLPEIMSELQNNLSLNGFTNVTCVQAAADEQSGKTSFIQGHHGGAGHLAAVNDAPGEQLTVETITFDEFIFEENNSPPNFIKMDIEGAESKALSGGERMLQQYRPILLIDLHTPEQDSAVGQILLEHGYEARRTEDGRRVKDLNKAWPHPDGLWGQIIAFPKA